MNARSDQNDPGEVEVYLQRDGRWRWVYRERATGIELMSNHSFETKAAAVASAHRAYPHIVPLPEEPDSRARKPLLKLVVIALPLLALLGVAIYAWTRR